MFKFIGIDMDGTLLNDSHQLSNENIASIKSARSSGSNVVITTGRPYSGVEKFLGKLDMDRDNDFVILYNGALIMRTSDKKIISESLISLSELYDLEKMSKQLGVYIHIVTENECISPYENEYASFEAELNFMKFEIKDFAMLDLDTKIYKVMFSKDEKELGQIFKDMPRSISDKYELTMSAPFYIDVLKKGVNKTYGVKTLCEDLGLIQKEVMCLGDSGNDINMIEYAGLGIAMGNGSLELRRKADFITLSNEENGVSYAIERFIL